jgi:cytochrome c biogenesis protein CcmG/thiol:disulfide interchange protein DsbE
MNSLKIYKFALFLGIVFTTILYSVYYRIQTSSYFDSKSLILKSIPEFYTETFFDGKEFSSRDLSILTADYFVFHFWGTWCAPCEIEFPSFIESMKKMSKTYKIHVLLIAVNDVEKDVSRWLIGKDFAGIQVTLLNDTESKMMTAFGSLKIPETFIFNKKHEALLKFIGPQDWSESVLEEKLTKSFSSQSI